MGGCATEWEGEGVMWRPRAYPPLGGRAAGREGGGRMPSVMDGFATRRQLGRGWPRAAGRWGGDPKPPQQGVLGLTGRRGRPHINILPTILHHNKGI